MTSRSPLRPVPGIASESSVELGLTAKSDALQHHSASLEICKVLLPCVLTACSVLFTVGLSMGQ